jgi:hypothetical protein
LPVKRLADHGIVSQEPSQPRVVHSSPKVDEA